MGASGKSDKETGALLYFLVQDIRETGRTLGANAAAGAADAASLKAGLDKDFERWISAIADMPPYRAFTAGSSSHRDAFEALQHLGHDATGPIGPVRRGFYFAASTLWRLVGLGTLFLAGLALMALVFVAHRAEIGEGLTHLLNGFSRLNSLGLRQLGAEFLAAPRTLFGLALTALMLFYLLGWLALARAGLRQARWRSGFIGLVLALIAGIFVGLLARMLG